MKDEKPIKKPIKKDKTAVKKTVKIEKKDSIVKPVKIKAQTALKKKAASDSLTEKKPALKVKKELTPKLKAEKEPKAKGVIKEKPLKKTKVNTPLVQPETILEEQTKMEASKFYPSQMKETQKKQMDIPVFPKRDEDSIPHRYNDNRLILMARDPFWCYAYWDLHQDFIDKKKKDLKPEWGAADLCIRVYDVTDLVFDGNNSHKYQDITVSTDSDNWYLNVWEAGRTYVVDLGYKTASGNFLTVLRSNAVGTPMEKASHSTDEEWMVIDSDFEEIFRLSGGSKAGAKPLGASENASRLGENSFGSETVSSFSLVPEIIKEKDFFLRVNTELILNGLTKKDAQVTVANEKVKLKDDGSFSLHFKLVDGEMLLPVTAVSADKTDSITIKISVERKTE